MGKSLKKRVNFEIDISRKKFREKPPQFFQVVFA